MKLYALASHTTDPLEAIHEAARQLSGLAGIAYGERDGEVGVQADDLAGWADTLSAAVAQLRVLLAVPPETSV